jgi:microcystin-dependent protein
MRRFTLALLATGLSCTMCVMPQVARAQATDPFLGEIQTFTYNFCPRGWAPLNGQIIPINQNQALFALLGTTYGGNGTTTFALPTARPNFTLTGAPLIQCIALVGVFPSRN